MPTDLFWGPFLNAHGHDSEEQKAFEGYLYNKGISADAGVDELSAAYGEFQAWITASYVQDASATDVSKERDVVQPLHPEVLGDYRLPQSAHADPRHQKPNDAGTRPPEQRVELPPPAEPPAGDAATASTGGTSRYSRRSGESSEGSSA